MNSLCDAAGNVAVKFVPLNENVGEVVGAVHEQVAHLLRLLATVEQVPLKAVARHPMGGVEWTEHVIMGFAGDVGIGGE